MRPRPCLVPLLCLIASLGAYAQEGGPKIALVIGNGSYGATPLRNPPNDAKDVASALGRLGFSVTSLVDGDQKQMKRAIDDFGDRCKGASVALFYYSGHGVQVGGENWLIPVRSEIQGARDVEYEGVQLGRVLAAMEGAGPGTSILILDACRNNPFPGAERSAARGLAVVGRKPPESVIVYSTEAGETAADGDGRNGTFTQALLKNLERAELSLNGVLMAVNADVRRLTENRQRPARYDNLTKDVFLNPQPASAASPDKARAQALVQGGQAPSAQQPTASVSVSASKKPTLVVERAYGSVKIETKAVGVLSFAGSELGEIRPGDGAIMNDIEVGPANLEMRYADGTAERLTVAVTKNAIVLASFVQGAARGGDPNVTRSGLVAEWLLDGNARDSGGAGYHGIVTGAKPAEDRFGRPGRAYKFEGKDYIKVASAPGLNFGKGAFTVAFWLKTSGDCGNGSDDYFISKYKDDSTPGWSIKERDAGLALLTNDSKWDQVFQDQKINDGSWRFIVVTRRADGQKIVYTDMAKTLDYKADPHDVSNDYELLFGRDGKDDWNAVCSLDDIRFYNRQLGEAELLSLYREGGWTGAGSLQPQDRLPRSGLVGEWLLDGNASDTGGSGYHGLVTGAKPAEDRFGRAGRAYKFGGQDYIKVASKPALNFGTGPFTVAFWLKTTGDCGNASDDYFVSKYRDDQTHGWSVKEREAGIALLTNGGEWDQQFAERKVNDGTWHFVALVRRADGQKLQYLDMGKALDYKAAPHDVSNDQDLLFARSALSDWNATCSLDDVRIYNRALGEAELELLYRDGGWTGGGRARIDRAAVPRTGLVAEWLFNGDAKDSGGKGYNGSVKGALPAANRFGKAGQALAFEDKDLVKVSSRPALNFGTGAWSLAFWLKTEGDCGSASDDYFVAKYNKDDGNGWSVKERDGSLGLLTTAGSWDQSFQDEKVNDGLWRLVVVTRRADGQKIVYNDLVKTLDYKADAHNVSNDVDLVFGRNEPYDGYARCLMDDVRLYNRVLSEDEVAALYYEGGWAGN
ncbi:MAG TPA: caspase family protein [Spirochaetales bacterium]|nr:caspase family protein [Spirochaetales bacterium]HRY56139.1 caspase family protein [Spirochaetia bacterium]HRZ66242.1 caspase family protein [Spirochaetia bacterium]